MDDSCSSGHTDWIATSGIGGADDSWSSPSVESGGGGGTGTGSWRVVGGGGGGSEVKQAVVNSWMEET